MSAGDARDDGAVVAFARPPIQRSTVVAAERGRAFDVFVRRLADWWPLTPFSVGGDRVRTVVVEEGVGGKVTEVWDDGTERVWGDVLEWDEPASFVMTWNVTGTPTVVALRFAQVSDAVTKVDLEHRGWDKLTEAELGEDCAIPGGYRGGAFHQGWAEILGRFQDHVDRASSTGTEPGRQR